MPKKKKRSGAMQRKKKIENLNKVAALMERHGHTKQAITFRFSSRVIKAHQARSLKRKRRLAHLQGSPSRKMSAVRLAPSITKPRPCTRPASVTSPKISPSSYSSPIRMQRTSTQAHLRLPNTSKASVMPPSTSKPSLLSGMVAKPSSTAISGMLFSPTAASPSSYRYLNSPIRTHRYLNSPLLSPPPRGSVALEL